MNTAHRLTVLVLCIPAVGCGWFGATSDPEATADEEDPPIESVTTGDSIVPDRPEVRLALNLKPGDRFPLVKTVEQTLEQATPEGNVVNNSRLRMQLVITVEGVEDGVKTLGVRYHRVAYHHDVAGERVAYDSAAPPRVVPPAALAYHGLVGNGFTFELGPDNRIRDVVGFREFLSQCLRGVAPDQRNAVLAQLEATQGEEGIANFVDDSIGLLPYDARREGRESVVKTGYQWKRERQMARPVPIHEANVYTLTSLDEDVAHIDVSGTISPSASFGPSDQQTDGVIVGVQNGRTLGYCTIRRSSGLPIESNVRRTMLMVVRTPDGNAFEQRKTVITRIETYEEQSSGGTAPIIVPASGERAGGPESPVVPADFSRE